jgi:hypothetical protein
MAEEEYRPAVRKEDRVPKKRSLAVEAEPLGVMTLSAEEVEGEALVYKEELFWEELAAVVIRMKEEEVALMRLPVGVFAEAHSMAHSLPGAIPCMFHFPSWHAMPIPQTCCLFLAIHPPS